MSPSASKALVYDVPQDIRSASVMVATAIGV